MKVSTFFKKIFSSILLLNCLGMIALTILLVVGVFFYLGRYTKHDEAVAVPDLRGLRADVALETLAEAGLQGEVVDTGYVEQYLGGVVLEQAIAAGDRVKAGRVVGLTINASEARAIALPDLADNSSRREAEARLHAVGFKHVEVEWTMGDQDWVYGLKVNGRSVSAAERVPVTVTITLVVGDGREDEEMLYGDSLSYDAYGADFADDFLEEGGSAYSSADSTARAAHSF